MPQASQEAPGCAIALIVVGLLILVPSGLCTTVVGLSSLGSLGIALVIGGPFILAGGGMVLSGIRGLRKAADAPPNEGPPP